jgi:hypothetical protein
MKTPDWKIFEQYIVERLKEIDPYCSRTPGSGNKGVSGDVKTTLPLHFEAKQRSTKDITIRMDVWEKLKGEIPIHADKTPVYCLEQKDKKRFAVLELDSFLSLFIEYYKLKHWK